MSMEDLKQVFRTIGTSFRRAERKRETDASEDGRLARPILGEKGVGRSPRPVGEELLKHRNKQALGENVEVVV